jgi:quinoprotein glucose dehydrogenase
MIRTWKAIAIGVGISASLPVGATRLAAQAGAPNGQWPTFAGDLGSTRYAPLDQIDSDNFADLEVAWVFEPDNLGPTADFNYQVTPLMIDGVLYATAGSRRNVVALDAATGELLWMYRLDEGQRAENAIRNQSGRGVAYWTDGQGDERIYHVTIGYQLVALDAKTGRPIPSFGRNGIVDLKLDDDQEIDPLTGEIGWNSAPIVARDVVLVGASHRSGGTPPSRRNVKGYVRGFDVRTGERKWIFHTIPMEGELGWDTWREGSAEYTGNTGVWTTFSVDAENGIAYLPIEIPTGDYVGVHRPGENLFGESLVAVDLETGERIWHFQLVHHPLWDYDIPAPPILADITVDGRRIQAVAQPSKQGWVYVFDRVTGEPVWPIVERPVERGTVPGEWYSPTQPFPTKPPPFERQGFELSEILDLTPELRADALEVAAQLKTGPVFTPPIVRGEGGKIGTLFIANGANWPGGSFDPETGILYVYSQSQLRVIGLTNEHAPTRSDMAYLAGAGGAAMEVQGLPIIKPPWGRITAIDLNRGEIVWQVAHGDTPEFVTNHPALRGVDIPRTGKVADAGGSSGGIGTLVTRTLVISGEGSAPVDGVYGGPTAGATAKLFAYDKATGREVGAVTIPSMQTGSPMTYMVGDTQYLVVATGGGDNPGRLTAFKLP